MRSSIAREVNRLAFLLAVAVAAAVALGSLWPVILALLGYIYWSTRELYRLYQWLVREEHQEPPDSSGLWGELYTRLEHLFRGEQRARGELKGIIERARSSVNALNDAVLLVDHEGRLEFFNPAAGRLLGFSFERDLGQALTNLIRNPDFAEYLQQRDFEQPIELPSALHPGHTFLCQVTEFGDGEQLILVRDITRLHNLEQMRKDFVANVSHELKTPLTVLKGYLETLLGTLPEDSTMRRPLQQMTQQSNRMEALVNDLLLLSRLESTTAEREGRHVRLKPLLERLSQDALALSEQGNHTVRVEVPEDAALQGEPGEIESAFCNLLTNAVKYSPAGGEVRVRWNISASGAGRLSVSDSGPGIESHHLPRLTERFYRPDTSRVTRTGGTGLGLAIVKHVLLRHDAHLEIRSNVGKGSTFTCVFPPARVVAAVAPHASAPADEDRG